MRPAGPANASASSGPIPRELIERGARRLRIYASLALVTSVVMALVPWLAEPGAFGDAREVIARSWVMVLSALLSSVVVVLTTLKLRRLEVRATPAQLTRRLRVVLDFGLVWYAAMLGLVSASDATTPWGPEAFSHGIPTACVVILIYPMLVPTSPRAFIGYSALGLGLTVLALLVMPGLVENPPAGPSVIGLTLVPMLFSVAVATVSTHIIHRLSRDLKQAQKTGSYELTALLGKGGMGEVWRARHGMLAREAAIKLIRKRQGEDTAESEEAVLRFQHEARVVSSLRSPNTVQLYDFGVTGDGALFYAMELLDGLDLDLLVRHHGPQPPERVIHILMQACHSLAEAHAKGLVHRDIKPANIFLAQLGRDLDVVKVLDFGLATRPVDAVVVTTPEGTPLSVKTHETMAGAIMGTPSYMAPEQILRRRLDGRTDLYALAAVGYWLLTGKDVFEGHEAGQIMFAHLHGDPEQPSKSCPWPCPVELDAVILRALEKDPEVRFDDADEMAAALSRVPLATSWTQERAREFWSKTQKKENPQAHEGALAETVGMEIIPAIHGSVV